MSYSPIDGLLFESFDGSGKGFVFSTKRPVGAYVLDQWSFTILEALDEMPLHRIREALVESASGQNECQSVQCRLDATVAHLLKLMLLKEVNDH